ncbi:unnamed protein product, partial [Ectocarpus sp. 12 AP-2014]
FCGCLGARRPCDMATLRLSAQRGLRRGEIGACEGAARGVQRPGRSEEQDQGVRGKKLIKDKTAALERTRSMCVQYTGSEAG